MSAVLSYLEVAFRFLLYPFSYGIFSWVIRLILSSLIVFVVVASGASQNQIVDIIENYNLIAASLSAVLFVALLKALYPIIPSNPAPFPEDQRRPWKLPSLFVGIALAALPQALLIADERLHFWGMIALPANLWELILRMIFETLVVVGLVASEEKIFREILFKRWIGENYRLFKGVILSFLIACILLIVRMTQFESLNLVEVLVHISLHMALGLCLLRGIPFSARVIGASAFYASGHVFGSAPLFGSEFSGLFIIKPSNEISLISGGVDGPYASALTLFCLLFLNLRLWFNLKKKPTTFLARNRSA
jgi:hypothetical protein